MREAYTLAPEIERAVVRIEEALQELRAGAAKPSPAPQVSSPTFAALRQWRTEQARSKGLPPYIIATDAVLHAIEAAMPTDLEQLQAIRGMGPAKVATYGPEILAIVSGREVAALAVQSAH
ncbi:MAG: HRDC domain-containing protein [bacterium]